MESKETNESIKIYKERFKEKKKENIEIAKLMQAWKDIASSGEQTKLIERANKVANCGTFLEFVSHRRDNFELNKKLNWANFCKDRLCPMCQWRLSRKYYGILKEVIRYTEESYNKTHNKPIKYILLTLTMKNCKKDELNKAIDILNKAYTNLRNTDKFKNIHLGSFKTVEVTYNKKLDNFHPHLHILLCVDGKYTRYSNRYIKQKDFISLWGDCLEDANEKIWIEEEREKRLNAIRYKDDKTETITALRKKIKKEVMNDVITKYNKLGYDPSVNLKFIDNIKGGTKEVTKYVVKGTDITSIANERKASEVLYQLADGIHGKRLIEYYGILKDNKKHIDFNEDLTDNPNSIEFKEGDKLFREVYKWGVGLKSYELTEVTEIKPID